ncbi:ell-associated factor Eaf-like [Oppia nitens]|uniref:ell-associated factor Eaf-like n=1 Tax=Oppia nitens TaxID=1686743 RepID=UPI0023DAE82C|nr:ell-associated factor Eaf-like [Oppia nitens]
MTMNTITERLGIGDEIRELKLGPTLTSKDTNNSFHTIRYDFKPASVDREKAAVLEVEANNKVTVMAPNTEGSGTSETVFKGSRKSHQKECVLIIDHKTGEITLEKLNQNIIVKRTRQQNPSKTHKPLIGRPNTPIDNKKLVPHLSQQKPNSPLTANNRQNSPNNSNVKQKASPNKANSNGHSLNHSKNKSPPVNRPISPSMPTLSSLTKASTTASNSSTNFAHNVNSKRDINNELGLSDSSSDSSDAESSSSSSNSSSDSSSDEEVINKPNSAKKHITNANLSLNHNNNNSNKPKASIKSDQSSSEYESDEDINTKQVSNTSKHSASNGNTSVLPSMPKFSQLSEDLRLSESGSDSD